jgi:hypothetical protein
LKIRQILAEGVGQLQGHLQKFRKNYQIAPEPHSSNLFKHRTPFRLKANHILTPPTFSPRGGFLSLS